MKLKKRKEYYKTYSKEQAAKMLREESCVKIVFETKDSLYIETKPITPIPKDKRNKKMFVCPIGTFSIKIEKYKKLESLKMPDINRLQGPFVDYDDYGSNGWHTHHIFDGWNNKVCWGNVSELISKLRYNQDWYWLAKVCLEIITDGNPEPEYRDIYDRVMLYLQYQYAIIKNNNQWKKKLQVLLKKKLGHIKIEERARHNNPILI